VLEEAFTKAGLREVHSITIQAHLLMSSAAECLRFERESFGALLAMMTILDQAAKEEAWEEIHQQLKQFETKDEFVGPCELVIATGTK